MHLGVQYRSRVSRVCPGSPRCLFTGLVPVKRLRGEPGYTSNLNHGQDTRANRTRQTTRSSTQPHAKPRRTSRPHAHTHTHLPPHHLRLSHPPGSAHAGRTDTRITQTNLTTIPQTLTNHPDPQTHTRTTARRARSRPSPRSPVLSTVPVPVYRFKNTGGSRDTKPTDTQNPDVYG